MKYCSILAFIISSFLTLNSFGQVEMDSTKKATVYVFDIKADIDPRMNRMANFIWILMGAL
jgi:hypothetical protein